jgi:hypothetical protein
VARAHQVLARVIDATHQITEALVRLAGHEHERQLTGREQPHQPLGVTPIGLDPITRRARIEPGAITRRSSPLLVAARAKPNPVGPASYTARTGRASRSKNTGTTSIGAPRNRSTRSSP